MKFSLIFTTLLGALIICSLSMSAMAGSAMAEEEKVSIKRRNENISKLHKLEVKSYRGEAINPGIIVIRARRKGFKKYGGEEVSPGSIVISQRGVELKRDNNLSFRNDKYALELRKT